MILGFLFEFDLDFLFFFVEFFHLDYFSGGFDSSRTKNTLLSIEFVKH